MKEASLNDALDTFFGPNASQWVETIKETLGGVTSYKRPLKSTVFMRLDEEYGVVRSWWKGNRSAATIIHEPSPINHIEQGRLLPSLLVPSEEGLVRVRCNPGVILPPAPKILYPLIRMRLIYLAIETHLGFAPHSLEAERIVSYIEGKTTTLGNLFNSDPYMRFLQMNLTARRISGSITGRFHLTTRKYNTDEDFAHPLATTTTVKGVSKLTVIGVRPLDGEFEQYCSDFIDVVPFVASMEAEIKRLIREFTESDDDFGFTMTPLNV